MKNNKLIIKYQDKYICNLRKSTIDFINIPNYSNSNSDFNNIDIFISLLCSDLLDDSFYAKKGLTYVEGLETFELFDPDSIAQLEENIFLYDLDKILLYLSIELSNNLRKNLCNLPKRLVSYSYQDLLDMTKKEQHNYKLFDTNQETLPFVYQEKDLQVSNELVSVLNNLNKKRTNKDVLLLYSGGKDSTLTALRLKKAGFNVYFMHFDNGYMLDTDKPYLTFKNTFANCPGYYFDYENHAINIKEIFVDYFSKWQKDKDWDLTSNSLSSEIKCLSCRMAMYTRALQYAREHDFKYLAEGARISQQFMIEQPKMLNYFKELANNYGIKILYPVLNIEDDELEKKELLENGFSTKSWEGKCIIGRPPKDKNSLDEKIIIDYYNEIIKPKMLSKIKIDHKYD